MKVGTDGVLLGAWSDVENAQSVLDIGTGTGLLALMAAQRNSHAYIDAIEIEPYAAREAQENVNASPWQARIRVYQESLFSFLPDKKYDCILCNPPFFTNSTKNPEPGRTLARHCDSLPHAKLLQQVKILLETTGKFSVVLPYNQADSFIHLAAELSLYPQKITQVLPNPGKPPKRVLLELSSTPVQPFVEELVVELSRHHYSQEYIQLTRDFYLKM